MGPMSAHPILDRGRPELPEPMSEQELEDFLTEAIGLYAEQTGTELTRLATFEEARLLLRDRGLVIGIGRAEFRVSIVRASPPPAGATGSGAGTSSGTR